jgi:4-amino-4-deoxy-L-arabinose transferase-like glycosyltransferase
MMSPQPAAGNRQPATAAVGDPIGRETDRREPRWPIPRNAPFYLLTAGAFAFLTIPRAAQPGMFVDGVVYAAISRNLAEGRGTFWSPFYTSTLYPQFHDHPPLGFALQAGVFTLFGDHLSVERAYSIVVGSLIGLLTILIWRSTLRNTHYDWLPLVFWLLPSTVTWSIVNNLLETTQTMFTTMAVLAFVYSLQSPAAFWVWAMLSGLCVVGAALTKGPTGFFPLAAPFIAAVVLRGCRGRALQSGAVMLPTVAAAAALVSWPSTAQAALWTYVQQQVAASVVGDRGGGRWSSLLRHLNGGVLMRMGALVAIGAVSAWLRDPARARAASWPNHWSWFFLLLALAGSLPVAISARIMGHYLVPSMPMYALAFAGVSLPWLGPALDHARNQGWVTKVAGALGALLLVTAVTLPALGGDFERRDADWMREYQRVSASMPRRATLATCEGVREDWALHAYMMRFFAVSLDPGAAASHDYYLQLTDRPCGAPAACRSITATDRLVLWDCRTAPSSPRFKH